MSVSNEQPPQSSVQGLFSQFSKALTNVPPSRALIYSLRLPYVQKTTNSL